MAEEMTLSPEAYPIKAEKHAAPGELKRRATVKFEFQ